MTSKTTLFDLIIHLEINNPPPPEQWSATMTQPIPHDRSSFLSTQEALLKDIQTGLMQFMFECLSNGRLKFDKVDICVEAPQLPGLSLNGHMITAFNIMNPSGTFTEENAISHLIKATPALEKWVGDVLLTVTLPLLSSGSAS